MDGQSAGSGKGTYLYPTGRCFRGLYAPLLLKNDSPKLFKVFSCTYYSQNRESKRSPLTNTAFNVSAKALMRPTQAKPTAIHAKFLHPWIISSA